MSQLCPPPILIGEQVLSIALCLRFRPHEDNVEGGGGSVVLITITLTFVMIIVARWLYSQIFRLYVFGLLGLKY